MTFEEFAVKLEADIKNTMAVLSEEINITREVMETTKHTKVNSLKIDMNGNTNHMAINLDGLYERLKYDMRYEEINGHVTKKVKEYAKFAKKMNLEGIYDYEKTKNQIEAELVNSKRMDTMLSNVIHTEIGDMAVVYFITKEIDEDKVAKIHITEDILQKLGVSKEELHKNALAITALHHPIKMKSMPDILAELSGMDREYYAETEDDMWVVMNDKGYKGAIALFYPGMMEFISKEIGGGYYVIPSSIHEMIIVPDNFDTTGEKLEEMIHEVNATEVPEKEVLSDNIYRYHAESRTFEMIRG